MGRAHLGRFHSRINLTMLLEPFDVALLGVNFDLPQQLDNARLKTRLAGVCVGNDGFDFNGDDKSVGSHEPGTLDSLA
jgi:hypothetical protein